MNIIVLLGRLVRDPEVRYTTTGKCVCQFTLAVDRPFTKLIRTGKEKPILSTSLYGVKRQNYAGTAL